MSVIERYPVNNINNLSLIESVNVKAVGVILQKIRNFQAVIKNTLKEGVDYGLIPGCGDKPTLLKPGAEKLIMLMGLTSEYEIIERIQDYDKPFFAFTVKCSLYKNRQKITDGLGYCNSREAKFAFKWVSEKELPQGTKKEELVKKEFDGKYGKYYKYRVDEDANSKANTILKMAKKRAQIDAALAVGSLSELFTQDIEDYVDIDLKSTEAQEPLFETRAITKPGTKTEAKLEPDQNIQQTKPFTLPKSTKIISDRQISRLFAISAGNEEVINQVMNKYGYESKKDIKVGDYEFICNEVESIVKAVKPVTEVPLFTEEIPAASAEDYEF